jgi:hypothetical protein
MSEDQLPTVSVKPRTRARALHPAMIARQWKPGESGGGGGRTGLYHECRKLAAEASPRAMLRLIELMDAADERVAFMAATAILDRSGVKPIEFNPNDDPESKPPLNVALLSPERRQQLRDILAIAGGQISTAEGGNDTGSAR